MNIVLIIAILGTFLGTTIAQRGYYWRDYKGTIPNDAYPAGRDNEGGRVFVGQTIHPSNTILSGSIYPKQKKIYYEFDGAQHSTWKNVLILCTLHPNKFKWVPVSEKTLLKTLSEDVHKLPQAVKEALESQKVEVVDLVLHKQVVPAGSDGKRDLLVGRVSTDEEVVVGKVAVVDGELEEIYLARNGSAWSTASYELLVYDPEHIIDFNKEKGSVKQPYIVINIYDDQTEE